MKRFIIERFCDSDKMGTFGELFVNGEHVCYTVEQPWRDNEPFKSCIPAGDYKLTPFNGSKYRNTLAMVNHVLDVGLKEGDAKRYACVLHSANRANELQGCIAFGDDLGYQKREWAISNSKDTTSAVLDMMQEGDTLTIIWKDHP